MPWAPRMPSSCAASRACSARWWRSTTSRSASAPASGGRCWARTAPARPRCSTPSPAIFRPTPEPSASSARTSPIFRPTSASGAACGGPTRSRRCSPACRSSTTSISPAAASPAAVSRLLRPRQNEPIMQSALGLVEAVHLTGVKDRLVAELSYGQQRQLEVALALAGRAALHPVRRAGGRPVADRALGADRDPHVAAEAYRLHHHRARHGRGAARRRARHDDAQRPHLQGRPAGGDRIRSRGAGALSRRGPWHG